MPSDRSAGFVFAGAALVVAWFWRHDLRIVTLALASAEILAVLAFSFPKLLRPLNVVWFKFGALLHKIMNPVVMAALYAIAIVPAGLIMQRLRDPLRLKRPAGATYWIDVAAQPTAATAKTPVAPMTRQF